ncbi:MAG TPA: GtrA family protein [Caulobacteraceae bacterium]|jgi:putative flippase GtrA
MSRFARFIVTGLLTTAVSYLIFIGLLKAGVQYLLASGAGWAVSLLIGFATNRRFTFGIVGPEKRKRDFGFYLLTAVLQLLIGWSVYAVLIGYLRLDPTLAFACNLVVTTAFSFVFLRFVTFRRAAAP